MNYKEYTFALETKNEAQIIYWIEHNLANYLKSTPENQEEIEHIIDYLASDEAPQNNMSAMSYEDAKKNTEKWVQKLIKKGEHIKEVESDTEVVLDFKDGFKIVKLIGKNAYDREGYLMRHCVASYYGSSKEIYSLRDADNMPHCTMEKNQQVKGKGNGNIHPKYVGYVVKFLEYIGMSVGDSEMMHLGYINVEKFKEHLSKDTKYFNDKYVPEDQKLLDTEGDEFASLDLLDVKPLIKESFDGELKIGFDLEHFIKVSVNFLFKFSKKKNNEVSTINEDDEAIVSSTEKFSQNASSGYSSKNASSGDSSQNASSGDSSKNASSGDYSTIEMTGEHNVGANIGINGKIKGKIGNWITLAEYDDKRKPLCVKSAQIDGEIIKEDIWYQLKNGEFTEVK